MQRDNDLSNQSRCRASRTAASLCAALLGLTLSLTAGRAEAEDYDPAKSGRVMLNARGGIAVGIANTEQDLRLLGMVGIDFGVAVDEHRNAYIVFTPQVDLQKNTYNVMVPLGFQYDIRLTRGLYLTPRMSLGYSALISNASADFGSLHFSVNRVIHGGVAIPELGLKYVINGRFNIGIEPLSFPIFFNTEDYAAWYRANAFLGLNF